MKLPYPSVALHTCMSFSHTSLNRVIISLRIVKICMTVRQMCCIMKLAVVTGCRLVQCLFVIKIKIKFESQNSNMCLKLISCHKKSQLFCTKVNFVPRCSILFIKIQFCLTKVNFVSQKSILYHKNSFLLHKIQICQPKLKSFSQMSILCHKFQSTLQK